MNLRILVRPALYGVPAGVLAAAAVFGVAVQQSVSIYLVGFACLFSGMTAFALLAGASSFNENSEDAEELGTEGDGAIDTAVNSSDLVSPPGEAGLPRRLTLAFAALALAASGLLTPILFG